MVESKKRTHTHTQERVRERKTGGLGLTSVCGNKPEKVKKFRNNEGKMKKKKFKKE
jgi:hypothetical protein